ncbi:RNA polymerase sigma-70 factor [Carboxylicivirga sp. A043]|uniref:RNA polymerase sigma-70 factor n=1 Tax=Carboxylicivirga litoralis TaxID=2816963 RepID=UPI0021CB532F|nr:RNA polymerase sigma-70 factor [Carboxylicivirga sp. A043]MCU4156984.1 RNA polymerase sigma-70 factor [Carboxylicivirga sp. A043]
MQISVDKNILKLLQQGDEGIYRNIFHQLQPALVVYAKEYVLDTDMASNIVQEAFLKLWEKRNAIKIGTILNAYLYKSVRNLCLNYLRHLKVEDKYADKVQQLQLNFEALKDKSAERLLEAEIMERIQVAVDKMTPQCKRVFELSRFEGKSYKEIALELGIAEKTVENQMGKALKVARAELKEFLPITILLYNMWP